MSVLTKVLIILLVLFSSFLCAIVVTYVGTANNYKAAYEDLNITAEALRQNIASLKEQLNEQAAAAEQMSSILKKRAQACDIENDQLQVELANKERANSVLTERINSWSGEVMAFRQIIANMEDNLKQTRIALDKGRIEQIEGRQRLNEIASQLTEKLVQLDALEAERRRLLEKNASLEEQITGVRTVQQPDMAPPQPVTPSRETVTAAPPVTAEVELQGIVTEVDLRNSLVTISLGTADGVKPGMTFHVTRGDEFICDIIISDVDTETSAGTMGITAGDPQVDDKVSTGWL
ncbi:MAG: hypothetical protein ABIG61_07480 [Planctomycetota bacterium]